MATRLSLGTNKVVFCCKHPGVEADHFCEQCNRCICLECIPHDHPCDLVSNAFHQQEKVLAARLEPLKEHLAMLVDATESVDSVCEKVLRRKTAVVSEIRTAMANQREALDKRERELTSQAENMALRKLTNLEEQHSNFLMQTAKVESVINFIEETHRTCSQGEILQMKTGLVKQMDDLTCTFDQEALAISEQADLTFTESLASMSEACRKFGKVHCLHSVCPEKCQASGEGVRVAMRGQTATLSVEALDSEGKACRRPVRSLKCELVSNDGKSRVEGTVKRKDDKNYEITYQPQLIGQHQLHISAQDQPILNSPFSVVVLPDLTAPERTIEGLKKPWGVAVREGGEVVVTECDGHCVTTISPDGERQSFGECGRDNGKFNHPEGLALDSEGDILVVEYDNDRVQKFTPTGEFVKAVGSKGDKEPLQFNQPVGIAVHPHTHKVYVADNRNNRIQVLNEDLSYCRSFGGYGSENGLFHLPYDVSIDSEGNVYVADYRNHRIQVFTADDDYLRQFSKKGEEILNRPASIAIDSRDLVYICEHKIHCVSIFTTRGEFIKSFGAEGAGPAQLIEPHGIAVDRNGTIYVCDTCGLNCIKVFA